MSFGIGHTFPSRCRGFLADVSALLGNESPLPSTFDAVDAFPPRLSRLKPSFDGLAVLRVDPCSDGPSELRLLVLGSTADLHRGAQQNASGKIHRFRHSPVATTVTRLRTEFGLSLLEASLPAWTALRRFAFARNSDAPTTSTRPPFAGAAVVETLRSSTGFPEQGPCLIGVGFPPSGPRVWTCTSYL